MSQSRVESMLLPGAIAITFVTVALVATGVLPAPVGWIAIAELALCSLLVTRLLRQGTRALERAGRESAELTRRSTAAEDATTAKSRFISTMAHEMRTPLAAVVMFAERMRDDDRDPLSPAQRRRAVDIAASTRHVLDLLDHTVDLAPVEAGRLELRPERISVAATAIVVVDGMYPLASDRGIEIALEADGKLGEVFLDPARLRQVMVNFLSNALKFTPAGGRVLMRVERRGEDFFLIAVDDTGLGIAPEELERIFGPDRPRTAPLHSQDVSTGLGLGVTKRLVEAMGGEVEARSVEGEGSTFMAVLPRMDARRLGAVGGSRFAPVDEVQTAA